MRVSGRTSAAATTALLAWLVPLVSGISVPTGKLTGITPAKPTPRTVNPHALANPAPVVEYTQEHPEPPPLDPSYVPQTFDYFDTLARHHVYYVPVKYRNFNAISNSIDYEPPHKYTGQTLGKNIDYKPYKPSFAMPYYPVRVVDWTRQYNNQNDNQYNNQFNNQGNNQYNDQANQLDSQNNNDYNNQNNQYQNVQTTQVHQAMSTPAAPAAVSTPQILPRKVDYSTGKGSYDVTGKGGSKSEYYSKDDWSKKTSYPKKVLGQDLTSRKYASHKY